MVGNSYDRYRIETIKRINSRYYLIKIHGKSYVWDYFNSWDFRNYFPFKIFCQERKMCWKIYDVTGDEDLYKAKPLRIAKQYPATMILLGLWPIYFLAFPSFFADRKFVLGLLILLGFPFIMFLLLYYIAKRQKINLKNRPTYILSAIETNKYKFMTLKKLFEIGIFIFVFAICFPRLDYELFYTSIIIAFGNVWENSTIMPNELIKYQIKEKKKVFMRKMEIGY